MQRPVFLVCVALVALLTATRADGPEAPRWAGHGSAVCTMCHTVDHGVHGGIADVDGGPNACEACHGPSAYHLTLRPDRTRPLTGIQFGPDAPSGPQNQACLACHGEVGEQHWAHSAHARSDLTCTACHTVHTPRDPAMERHLQLDNCSSCHQDVRAELHRRSAHPVLRGTLACTDCHNPHGSSTDADLVRASVNETCYACHAEKRGPFLWEHPPVTENCSTCHQPHGSVHDALLTQRTPFLCQQCHLARFHPSAAQSGTGVPPAGASASMLLRNCMNCHTQVHGSNHPSGAGQTR